MEGPLVPLAIFAAITIVVVAGIAIWWGLSGDDEAVQLDRQLDQQQFAPTPATSAPAASTPPTPALATPAPATPPPAGTVEVMRILRDVDDKSLIVEMDGEQYHSLREINDPTLGKRFMGNTRDLAKFARLGKIPMPTITEDDLMPPQQKQPDKPAPPPQEPVYQTAPSTAPIQQGGEEVVNDEPGADLEPLSVADQIDEIVQHQIAQQPAFQGRDIRVTPTITGGVNIIVDDKSYEAVDEIEEDDVRSLIQSAVAVWEERQ